MNSIESNTVPVLIVDGSAILRERLAALLRERPSLEVVGVAGTASEGWTLFRQQHPAAVVLDVRLRDGSGIEVLRRIKQADPHCLVVVLTNYMDPEYQEECRRHGADYFLHKAMDFEKAADLLCHFAARRTGASQPSSAQWLAFGRISSLSPGSVPKGNDAGQSLNPHPQTP